MRRVIHHGSAPGAKSDVYEFECAIFVIVLFVETIPSG